MSKSAQEQIQSLHERLMHAQISFDLWNALYEARTKQSTVDVMQPYSGFFTGIEHALFNSFVVLLYTIYEKRSDSIHIPKLLQTLKNESSIDANKKAEFDAKEKALKPIWGKIKVLRNKVVGHQDLYNPPSYHFEQVALDPDDIQKFLKESQDLLSQISYIAFSNALAFNIEAKPHLDALLKRITRKSSMRGTSTSEIEVSLVSKQGFWLLLETEELFVPYNEFPWFKKATIEQITTVEHPSPNHLYWPMLDIDLSVESIRHPGDFPLVAKT